MIPSKYRRVEYIQNGTGGFCDTHRILTGLKWNEITRVTGKVTFGTNIMSAPFLVGISNPTRANPKNCQGVIYPNTAHTVYPDGIGIDVANSVFNADGTFDYRISTTNAYYIFISTWSSGYVSTIQYYELKFYSGDTLVGDFVPIYNTELEVYEMFDEVSGSVCHNLGTGAFTGGPFVAVRKNFVVAKSVSSIPPEYEEVEYVENGFQAYLNTNLYANDNMELCVKCKAITGSFYLLQSRQSSSATIYGISGSQTNNTITSFGLTSGITRTSGHIYTIKVTLVNRAVTLYVKDETTNTEDTKTGTASASTYPFPSPSTIKLFGDASRIGSGVDVYEAYIKSNGSMAWHICGVKRKSDNAIGVWEFVSKQFQPPSGGSFTGGNPVSLHTEIKKFVVAKAFQSKNLFNRPNGSYTSSDRGSISVSNQVITVNYQWGSAWSIYKLSGTVSSFSISASLTQMKSMSTDSVLFESGKTYVVKLFDSTTDYYDLQIANTATNMQIRDGVAFTPTENFNSLWVRTQDDSTAGNHTFKAMLTEGSVVPTEWEPYGSTVKKFVIVKEV